MDRRYLHDTLEAQGSLLVMPKTADPGDADGAGDGAVPLATMGHACATLRRLAAADAALASAASVDVDKLEVGSLSLATFAPLLLYS